MIVDEASSDPGLPGDPPVPVDANHVSIVKPFDRSSILYALTRDFIAKGHPVAETQEGALKIYPLPPIRSQQSLNVVPKLIRIAAIGLVGLIGYIGVEQIQKPLIEQLATKDAQIAALIKMLGEKNPSAASGPGAQQALGAAVKSIAQGAKEGDPRLKQAFGLLEENKIAEATQLLNAVAVDKTAHAEQATKEAEQATKEAEKKTAQAEKDRKEAAIAYRNLGAIAGLADPKRALEAYEKALALDPDDIESLYGAGSIQIEYGDLNAAQARLERVLTLAKTEDQAFDKYWALLGLGDIKERRGDLQGALKSYNDGLAIIDRLAKADPGNAGWQRDLFISNSKIADVLVTQGNLPEALKSYQAVLVVSERLAKADPGNAGWQRDLSVSYEKVDDVLVAQGNLPEALKTFRDGLAIAERLAKSDPGNAVWQRDLAVAWSMVGIVQKKQGNLSAALKSYQDGLVVFDRLAKSDPGNAQCQYDLGISNERVGDVQLAQGDLSTALERDDSTWKRILS